MSNVEKYPKCHMRTSLGNCDPVGGFCTSVKTTICEALHKVAEPKTGEWVFTHVGTIAEGYYCSRCGKHGHQTDFCPNCGARMLNINSKRITEVGE